MQRTILISLLLAMVVLGHWAWFCPVADYAVISLAARVSPARRLVSMPAVIPPMVCGYLRHWQRHIGPLCRWRETASDGVGYC